MPRLWRLEERGAPEDRVKKRRAFTRVELLVMIVCVALLALLLIPALSKSKAKAQRIRVYNNLKQIGMVERLWSGDHQDHSPVLLLTNGSGGLKFPVSTNGSWYSQVFSNQPGTPGVLHCPSDTARPAAASFAAGFSGLNVSYFFNVDTNVDESQPALFLAGDRNITNGTPVKNGVLTLSTNHPAGWTAEMHPYAGNVGLSDGSVQRSPLPHSGRPSEPAGPVKRTC